MPNVTILWGSEAVRNENKPVTYSFDSQKELDAFLKGVEESSGWMEYDIIKDKEQFGFEEYPIDDPVSPS